MNADSDVNTPQRLRVRARSKIASTRSPTRPDHHKSTETMCTATCTLFLVGDNALTTVLLSNKFRHKRAFILQAKVTPLARLVRGYARRKYVGCLAALRAYRTNNAKCLI